MSGVCCQCRSCERRTTVCHCRSVSQARHAISWFLLFNSQLPVLLGKVRLTPWHPNNPKHPAANGNGFPGDTRQPVSHFPIALPVNKAHSIPIVRTDWRGRRVCIHAYGGRVSEGDWGSDSWVLWWLSPLYSCVCDQHTHSHYSTLRWHCVSPL